MDIGLNLGSATSWLCNLVQVISWPQHLSLQGCGEALTDLYRAFSQDRSALLESQGSLIIFKKLRFGRGDMATCGSGKDTSVLIYTEYERPNACSCPHGEG